ncbi:MAG: DoxX family protein [Gammaproteobacteria bacterium]
MLDSKTAPIGALCLRVALGILLLTHSLVLLFVTLSEINTFFQSRQLPEYFGYVISFSGLIGGISLIIGFYTRYVSLLFIPAFIAITYVAPLAKEYPAFISVALFVQFLLGDGVWAIKKSPALSFVSKFSKKIKLPVQAT